MADIVIKAKLLDNTEVVWDKRWIKSIETNVQSTSDASTIQYGALDSSGSATIIDIDGSIYQNIINGNLKKDNLEIQVFLNGKQIRKHIVTDSSYDKNTNILSLTLQGDLYKLAQEDYDGVQLNVNKTAYELVNKVLTDFGYTSQQVSDALSNKVVVGTHIMKTIENYLKSITIPYSFIKRDGKKIDAINEICKLAQLQAYEDDSGNIKFVSARPAFSESQENVCVINANCQYSSFDSSIILKNKISSVGYKSNNSYISAKKDETLSINTYDQTNAIGNVSMDGEEKQYYSGLYSDYTPNLAYESTQENGFYIFGDYPVAGADFTNQDRALVCKYTFDSNKFILDDSIYDIAGQYSVKKAILIPMKTTKNKNAYSFTIAQQFSQPNKYALQFKTESDAGNTEFDDLTMLLYTPTFVNSESDALSALCNMSGGNIVSVKPHTIDSASDVGRFIQIIKNGNLYTCYFCIYDIATHLTATSLQYRNYTGNLEEILTNFSFSTFIRCLIESYYDVDIDSDFVLPQGYLFHSQATIDGLNLYNSVKSDILTDYADGVSNAQTTVSIADYYDTEGNKIKNAQNGDIFQIGEIVRVDKDNSGHSARTYSDDSPMLWRVVGRKVRKTGGVPFIDLNLMECKAKSAPHYTLSKGISTVTRTYSPSGAPTGNLTDSDALYEGDTLTITYSEGIRSYTITMGGSVISSGSDLSALSETITVSGNVAISITAKTWHWVEYNVSQGESLPTPSGTIGESVILNGATIAGLDPSLQHKLGSLTLSYRENSTGMAYSTRRYNEDFANIYVDSSSTTYIGKIINLMEGSDIAWDGYPYEYSDDNRLSNFLGDSVAIYLDGTAKVYLKRYYNNPTNYLTQWANLIISQYEYS